MVQGRFLRGDEPPRRPPTRDARMVRRPASSLMQGQWMHPGSERCGAQPVARVFGLVVEGLARAVIDRLVTVREVQIAV